MQRDETYLLPYTHLRLLAVRNDLQTDNTHIAKRKAKQY